MISAICSSSFSCEQQDERSVFIKELGRGDRAVVELRRDKEGIYSAFKKFHRKMPSYFPQEAASYWESLFDEQGISKRAQFEWEIAQHLHHPAFVRLESIFQERDQTVLKMEYIEEESFSSLTPLELLAALKDLMGAFQEAYRAGWIYADFTFESNILIEKKTHRLRVIDLESFERVDSYIKDRGSISPFFRDSLVHIGFLCDSGFSKTDSQKLCKAFENVIEEEEVFEKWGLILHQFQFEKAHDPHSAV